MKSRFVPVLNPAWPITEAEVLELFRPGQLRAHWSRKRRLKYLRRWRGNGRMFIAEVIFAPLPTNENTLPIIWKRGNLFGATIFPKP